MEIAALLLTLGVTVLVGLYLYAPLLERRARRVTQEEHELSALMAERDRVVNSLQELDFDFKLGKIPEEDYPAQRAWLLQNGADILRRIDALAPSPSSNGRGMPKNQAGKQDTETMLEQAIAARRAGKSARNPQPNDDDIESMIAARRKSRRDKSAGFCPNCGKPVLTSDKFCPSCGKPLS
jgi:hypothetical protein